MTASRYIRPDWFTINVFNRITALLTRCGISVYGSRILAVRGRTSGEWRTTPVNLLTYESARYLVAPRGTMGAEYSPQRRGGTPAWESPRSDPGQRTHR